MYRVCVCVFVGGVFEYVSCVSVCVFVGGVFEYVSCVCLCVCL